MFVGLKWLVVLTQLTQLACAQDSIADALFVPQAVNPDVENKNYSKIEKEMTFKPSGSIRVSLKYSLQSPENGKLEKSLLKKGKQESILKILNQLEPNEKKTLTKFDLQWQTKEGRELVVTGEYSAELKNANTVVLPFPSGYERLFTAHIDNPGNFNLSSFTDVENTIVLKNVFAVGKEPKACNLQTSWFKASRSIEYLANGITIKDSIKINKAQLTSVEMHLDYYDEIIGNFRECFEKNEIHISTESKKHLVVTKDFEDSLASVPLKERLSKRIEKAIEVDANCNTSNKMHKDMIRVILEKNLADDPTYIPTYQFLSYFYQNNDNEADLKKALSMVDAALNLDAYFPEGLISRAVLVCRLGDCALGKQIIETQLLTQDHSKFSYYVYRGLSSYYGMRGDRQNNLKYLDLALKKAERIFEKAEAYERQGSWARTNKDLNSCIENFKRAIEIIPDSACYHYNLGCCYKKNGEYDKAIVALETSASISENYFTRHDIAFSYALKGIEYSRKMDMINSNKMFDKSLEAAKGWRVYIDLVEFYLGIHRSDYAHKAAIKAAEQYDDEPKKLAGFILLLFKQKNTQYSTFMRKIVGAMTNKYHAGELGYHVAHDLQSLPHESQAWINESLVRLKSIKIDSEDKELLMQVNVLVTKFYLLKLSLNGSLLDLQKANDHLAIAKAANPRSQKVVEIEFYVGEANRGFGKGRYLWDTRLSYEMEYGLKLPMWIVYWMYNVF